MNKQMSIAEVLAYLMETRGVKSATALHKASGVPQPTIWRILKGTTTDPETLTVRLLAKFFDITEGQMRGTEPLPDLASNVEEVLVTQKLCPLISWVQAGAWTGIVDNFSPSDADEWMACPVPHSEKTFVLKVRGESMFNPYGRPSFADGDLIFVDPDKAVDNGALVVVRLDDDKSATFKKLIIEGERKFLKPLNPAWPEPIIEVNGNATICGVVILKAERL